MGWMLGAEAESGRRVSELAHAESCQDRVVAHLNLYRNLALASLVITLIMISGFRMTVKRITEGRTVAAPAWRALAYTAFLAGAAKFLLGVILLFLILLILLSPEACPRGVPTELYLYPTLWLLLGTVCLCLGRSYHRLMNNTTATAALQQSSAAQLNTAPSSEEVSHVDGDAMVALGVPLVQTSPAAGPSEV